MRVSLYLCVWVAALLGSTFAKTLAPQAECTTQEFRLRNHFSPHENWSNDPNGLVYYEGQYHLFFQYHPYSTQWGPMHWGHAVSTDLVTWTQVDIALYPDDVGTAYSGSAVVDYKNTTGFQKSADVYPVIAIFTSAGEYQTQSIAYSTDKAMTFSKFEGNPVLNLNERDFRDPKVFWDEQTSQWTMVVSVMNRIEFYGSPDLKRWTKLSEFGRDPEQGNHASVWECPDFMELSVEGTNEKRWLLIISIGGGGPNGGTGTHYLVGNWNGTHFSTNGWNSAQWMDWGPDNYAGISYSNEPQNRTLWLGWMANGHYAGATPTSTWRGQFTLPRQLSLVNLEENQYRVRARLPREVESLRLADQHLELSQELSLLPNSRVPLTSQAGFRNPLMEIRVTLEMKNNPSFSLCVHNFLGEEVCVGHNTDGRWFIDRTKSGRVAFHDLFVRASYSTAPREVTAEETTLTLFVDTTSIEVFADDGLTVFTQLFFPTELMDQVYIHHRSGQESGASLKVKRMDIWGLACGVQAK